MTFVDHMFPTAPPAVAVALARQWFAVPTWITAETLWEIAQEVTVAQAVRDLDAEFDGLDGREG